MRIEDLAAIHVGLNVVYHDFDGREEFGRLKRWNRSYCFVLWKGDLEPKAVDPKLISFEMPPPEEDVEKSRANNQSELRDCLSSLNTLGDEAEFAGTEEDFQKALVRMSELAERAGKHLLAELSLAMREGREGRCG